MTSKSMNENENRPQEWTVDYIFKLQQASYKWRELLVAAHNAALTAADEKWRDRFRKFEKIEEKFGPAQQRSQTQEWTPEYIGTFGLHLSEVQREELSKRITAALTAEREATKKFQGLWRSAELDRSSADQELADERELRETAEHVAAEYAHENMELVKALEKARESKGDFYRNQVIDAALAKVKEAK
jgi:hypothetical protein